MNDDKWLALSERADESYTQLFKWRRDCMATGERELAGEVQQLMTQVTRLRRKCDDEHAIGNKAARASSE